MCATMKYESVCCRSTGGDACMMPDSPPMVNIAMKLSANFIDVVKFSEPPQMVPIQLKIFTPVGTAISMVVRLNTESAIGPMPVENMWCAHTPQPMMPMKMPENTTNA